MKTYILKVKHCSLCPNILIKKPHFYCLKFLTHEDTYKEILNFTDIPKWCPLPNYDEEIISDFIYELSLTDEDRKKMRMVAKNPDGSRN